jgi:5'-methylthioadenosine phosphorylase
MNRQGSKTLSPARIGIIGGTGLGDTLLAQGGETVEIQTPYGSPSGPLVRTAWEGVEVVFLARHGLGHGFNPSTVPYRANLWAMKKLGVETILASGATGSLREDIEPGHLVLCDQVIDKTFRRASTFFDEGVVAHVELAEPFCPRLRRLLANAGERVSTTVHHAGTYVCMEGPQFSTRAESNMHRQWGGDLIGMTCMPEARLAREAEICYALLALPTDYDCWRPHESGGGENDLLKEILGNLRRATDNAIALMREAVCRIGRAHDDPKAPGMGACRCRESLRLAIWSDKQSVDAATRERLGLLIGKYL